MAIFNSPFFEIDKSETKRYAGLRKSEIKEDLIDEACNLARLIIKPMGNWEIYDYDDKNQIVGSDPPFHIKGESIKKHLMGCKKVVLLSATVGKEIEEKITSIFKEGKYTLSLLLDAAATSAVEQNANLMEKAIYKAKVLYAKLQNDSLNKKEIMSLVDNLKSCPMEGNVRTEDIEKEINSILDKISEEIDKKEFVAQQVAIIDEKIRERGIILNDISY